MQYHSSHIPKNKFDFASIERLNLLPFKAVKKDVPLLLEWLQDGNWPVAQGVAKYLRPHVNEISDELLMVLASDDSMWKYWIIYGLLSQFPGKLDFSLVRAVRRIAESPTKIEIEDAVNEAANDLIETMRLQD